MELAPPLSAVLAEQGDGVGVALQLSWATWFATAAFQIDCHVWPVSDVVMTLDVVSSVPDAAMSWLIVTLVLAKPAQPARVTFAALPRFFPSR